MEPAKSTYPIPEQDFGLLMGLVGALNPADRDVFYKRLGSHPFELKPDSPCAIFWAKITAMGLAGPVAAQEEGNIGFQLTQQGWDALSLTQAYMVIADNWPHRMAVTGDDAVQ